MTTPHKHAEVLRAIADGKEVEHEHANKLGTWVTPAAGTNPISCPHLNWRIKEIEMVYVGRHSWPMPLTRKLEHKSIYWSVELSSLEALKCRWGDYTIDNQKLASGIVHLTKEAAEQHAAALRCITRGDVE